MTPAHAWHCVHNLKVPVLILAKRRNTTTSDVYALLEKHKPVYLREFFADLRRPLPEDSDDRKPDMETATRSSGRGKAYLPAFRASLVRAKLVEGVTYEELVNRTGVPARSIALMVRQHKDQMANFRNAIT